MGAEKVKLVASAEERQAHIRHLLRDLKAMQIMLDEDLFESDVQRIGAEQELCMVDKSWRPAPILMELLERIDDPRFTTEFARFNMEINLDPIVFRGNCLSQLEKDTNDALLIAEQKAQELGAHVLLSGILPTIRQSDIHKDNITPLPRYHALHDLLHQFRGGNFEFYIRGADTLILHDASALFEASNTSWQIHLQTTAADFVKMYNWSMAVSAPLMAVATNSPLLLGKRLWRESRIALFQQAIDTRNRSQLIRERVPRVCFGTGWLQGAVTDIFKEDIARHPVMLASTREEDAVEVLRRGGIPKLYALNIHNGTVYKWNRPCYGLTDGKAHLRIEMRILPSGPTVVDEIANSAFWLGMMKGLPKEYETIHEKMNFDGAKENFFKAARHGLGSYFWWMRRGMKRIPAAELILQELLPIAREGLQKAKIDQADIDKYLGIIQERVETGRTGSQWQFTSFEALKKTGTKDEALVGITAGMYRRQQEGKPVANWSLAEAEEAGNWVNRYWTIEQIMSTDLFTAGASDPIDFVANVMHWRNIRHLPIENDAGELVGMVTSKGLLHFYSQSENHPVKAMVADVMATDVITVQPETTTIEALRLMQKNDLAYLPVVRGEKLVGLVTEHDFINISANMLSEFVKDEAPAAEDEKTAP